MSKYRYSHTDKDLLLWFKNDPSVASLKAITIGSVPIRGLKKLRCEFRFPITAIAGQNGTGKSTLLALAACAFHNTSSGYNPLRRKYPWYTISDFFMNASGEPKVAGGVISYDLHLDYWAPSKEIPTGVGIAKKMFYKIPGGRWSNYADRVFKDTVFLGVDRVVPYYERSVYQSYHRKFVPVAQHGHEADVALSVGRILGRDYSDLTYSGHRGYELPLVKRKTDKYSGFNMGAGENALFFLFSLIFGSANPMLLVIDEIELGLHEEAQARLIDELKSICKSRKLQVVCTTHSCAVLERLPPEARLFLERRGAETAVLEGISPAFAVGKLSGRSQAELDVLVEDELADEIILTAVPNSLRQRIRVLPVGSHAAVMRHMAMRYTEGADSVCALLDGDQQKNERANQATFVSSVENPTKAKGAAAWLSDRIAYLPGGPNWPENWLMSFVSTPICEALDAEFGVEASEREQYVQFAQAAGKHQEFGELGRRLGRDEGIVRSRVIQLVLAAESAERARLTGFVSGRLDA